MHIADRQHTLVNWIDRQRAQPLLEVLGAVLLAVLSIWGLILARQTPPVYGEDFTATAREEETRLVGFYDPESNGDYVYRWTKGNAFIQLPLRYNTDARYTAAVRIRAANPDGPQPLTFLLNQRTIATVTPNNNFRIYDLVLPPDPEGDALMRFGLRTTPFRPTADQRDLGVIVSDLEIRQVRQIDWTTTIVIPLALLGFWGWLRRRGEPPGVALLISALLAAALVALYAIYRSAPLHYLWMALLALLAAATGATLARETASRLALALIAALVGFSGMLWPSWFTDDAFISFRYAQNLVAGNGLIYNIGERVEGYTNFLWTMLAALVLWLGGDPVFWAYVAGVALGLAIVQATYWLARVLLDPPWALVATLIVATSQSLFVYTTRGAGLETGLFTLLGLLGSALYIQRMWAWSGFIFALAALTRPEGVLLMGLTMLHRWIAADANQRRFRERIRAQVRVVGPFLLIVAPFFLWRLSYYGDLLPNTFYAKTGGGLAQVWRGLQYSSTFALAMGGPLLLTILAPPLIDQQAMLRRWWNYLLPIVVVYSAYIISVGGDHFPGERFFVPLTPWIAILTADGLAWIYRWGQRYPLGKQIMPAALAIVLTTFSWHALSHSKSFDRTLVGNDESVWIWRELGLWMNENTPPDASIAALGAGAIAYYSDRTTIDLLGLNDRHIARVEVSALGSGTAGHEKSDPHYVLYERQPTYIPRIWDGYFDTEPGWRDQYELITIKTRYGRELELWKRKP